MPPNRSSASSLLPPCPGAARAPILPREFAAATVRRAKFSQSSPELMQAPASRVSEIPMVARSSPEFFANMEDANDACAGAKPTPRCPTAGDPRPTSAAITETIAHVGTFAIPATGGTVITRRDGSSIVVDLPCETITLLPGQMATIKPANVGVVSTCIDHSIFADADGQTETIWAAEGPCSHNTGTDTEQLEDSRFALAVTNFPMSRLEARGIFSSRDRLRARVLNSARQRQIEITKDLDPAWEEKPRVELSLGTSKVLLVRNSSPACDRLLKAGAAEPAPPPPTDIPTGVDPAWEMQPRFELSLGSSKLVLVHDLGHANRKPENELRLKRTQTVS